LLNRGTPDAEAIEASLGASRKSSCFALASWLSPHFVVLRLRSLDVAVMDVSENHLRKGNLHVNG
jgi:hypothetical protein